MATNPPAKRPNVKRVAVGAVEVPFSFDGVVSVIGFTVHVYEQQTNLLMSFEAGGTASPDNYFTLHAGDEYIERDINWTPDENGLYFLSAGDEIIVEVIYWG